MGNLVSLEVMNGKTLGIIVAVIALGLGVFLMKGQVFNNSSAQTIPQATTVPSEASTPAIETEETSVELTPSGYSPASLNIKVGTKVTFINKSGVNATVDSDPHPVHTSFPALNLGTFKNEETLTFTFDKNGTYGYHNHLNATQKGTVIVE